MLNVLVFGAGVYVQGHNNSNFLAILTTLIESIAANWSAMYIKSTSSKVFQPLTKSIMLLITFLLNQSIQMK